MLQEESKGRKTEVFCHLRGGVGSFEEEMGLSLNHKHAISDHRHALRGDILCRKDATRHLGFVFSVSFSELLRALRTCSHLLKFTVLRLSAHVRVRGSYGLLSTISQALSVRG